jgi:hypothetical protein
MKSHLPRKQALRNRSLPKLCLLRDRICRRCSYSKNVATHHIVPFADGGTDDLSNMIALCGQCHADWHTGYEGYVPFDEWLTTIPPVHILRSMLRLHPDVTLTDVRSYWDRLARFQVHRRTRHRLTGA